MGQRGRILERCSAECVVLATYEVVRLVAHHADYLERREDHALCGATLENADTLINQAVPTQFALTAKKNWFATISNGGASKALAATAELETLRAKYGELDGTPLVQLEEEGSTEEPAETEPTTLLDHATRTRGPLSGIRRRGPLCSPEEHEQAFSERLESHERLVLAQEIGGDGSLMRWSTTAVKALGLHVANNPVQEEPEAMWDALVEHLTRRRRSPNGDLGAPDRTRALQETLRPALTP